MSNKLFKKTFLIYITIISLFLPTSFVNGQIAESITAIIGATVASSTETVPSVPVADPMLRSKETGLVIPLLNIQIPGAPSWDSLMYNIASRMIEKLTDDVVDWINRDFEGSPAFASDPDQWLREMGDRVAGKFIDDIGAGFICEPFRLDVKLALSREVSPTNDPYRYNGQCTLSSAVTNFENFINGDFAQGGWLGFSSLVSGTNNASDAFLDAQVQLKVAVAGAREIETAQLNWGGGFLGKRECVEQGPSGCVRYKITSPGTVVNEQLNKVLGSETDRLNLADEFDEVVGALIGYLMGKVFDGPGILASGGRSASGGSGGSGTTQAVGQCYPSKREATIGEEITWRTSVFTISTTTTITWKGSGGLTGQGDTASITYQTDGPQTASIEISDGSGKDPATIQCGQQVIVSRYQKLSGQCVANKTNVASYSGSQCGGNTNNFGSCLTREEQKVTYTATVTGGSGVATIYWLDNKDIAVGERESAVLVRTPNSNPPQYTAQNRYIFKQKDQTGSVAMTFNVVDADKNLPVLANVSCPAVFRYNE